MTNNENSNSKKRIKLIYVILFVVFVLSLMRTTFSAWNWYSDENQGTLVEFKIPPLGVEEFSCAADGGGNITTADKSLAPTTCMDTTYAIQREIKVMPTILEDGVKVNMDAWLKINEIGEGFTNSQNLRYALTTSSSSCTSGVVSSGNFYEKEAGDIVPLLSNKGYIATTTETYYLYIWLDAVETSPSTMRQPLNLSLGGSCSGASKIESPVLDDGMIPVKLSSTGMVTTVSSSDPTWYNYNNKEWANVVLVEDDSRSTYKNTNGVTVNQNDILAYYVWIPRYKYKVLNNMATGELNVDEQTIDIAFESASEDMSLGTVVGEYRTHPAFWWDNNSNGNVDNGEMVAGIWVGKFETTGDISKPTILPNQESLREQSVSEQFTTSKTFDSSGNIYGLSELSVDAHMMKNSEWGAVAYLSHSKYGINDEIRINNNDNYLTGCGASAENGESTSACEISYNGSSTPQSTTGNITGIYDMSGGSYEYVMGLFGDSDGTPIVATDMDYLSGFNGLLSDNTLYTSGIDLPASKYYDLYTSDDILTACSGSFCYGHALSETYLWYDDYEYFVELYYPWLSRGGSYNNGSHAGSFSFTNYYGGGYQNSSWRSVLVVNDLDYDSESPTCSLSVDGTTINASYSDDSGVMEYYGWDSSYSGANSTSRIIDAVGTYTYYVMDGAGNRGSCSITITGTTHNSWPLYCTGNCSGLAQAACKLKGGCYWNGQGKYCTGTYEYQCNTYHEYVCGSGYTKINDSYCYILG